MITNENKKLAQWAMEYALKNGCQSSRVTLYNGSSSSFEIRDMKIDRLQQASENSMVVHLFVDGRYGSYSTNRLDKKELEKFIKDGIAATRFLAEDKARTLPDASLYYKGGAADLRLVDPNFDSVQPDDKVALAMSVCEEIMGKDDRAWCWSFSCCLPATVSKARLLVPLMAWWGVSASVGRVTPVPSLIGTTLPCIMTSW